MARRDALLRLHKSLLGRRADIRRRLEDEMEGLRNLTGADATGDSADAAFELGSEEMASQLAELDAHEMHQIEHTLFRLKQGSYGLCEGCGGKIPVGRLNALPYTTQCIACQREMEKCFGWAGRQSAASWEKAHEVTTSLEEQPEKDLAQVEIEL
jgi:DnaK suppressor protein